MTQEKMYILLKKVKYKLTKQQYNTIKGQINCGDVQGAYKGIIKLLNERSVK